MPDDEYEDPELAALEAMAEEQHRNRFAQRSPGAPLPERDVAQQNDLPMDPDQVEWERREARRARR